MLPLLLPQIVFIIFTAHTHKKKYPKFYFIYFCSYVKCILWISVFKSYLLFLALILTNIMYAHLHSLNMKVIYRYHVKFCFTVYECYYFYSGKFTCFYRIRECQMWVHLVLHVFLRKEKFIGWDSLSYYIVNSVHNWGNTNKGFQLGLILYRNRRNPSWSCWYFVLNFSGV